MKISVQWLSEFVPTPAPVELATRLTLAGLEVESLHSPAAALEGVVVAQIQESKPHPDADKLSVTQVEFAGQRRQVVCGAKNYRVGDKVALATVGTTLPTGATIQRASLRGVESSGMLCSAKELGLSEDGAGLLILNPSLQTGTPIARALGLDDVVLDVNVTPNRPDALSHLGVAREVSVLTGAALKLPAPKVQESGPAAESKVKIRVEDPERCGRYGARVIEGVKVSASPDWMAARLRTCGVRPINNVVDSTNYVLLELGQPLHAFDLDKLAGSEVVVRRARKGERLTTLDGKERLLDEDDLLICDRDRPHVLAGVMGGALSEVGSATTRIFLEGAWFEPSGIRRSARRHGLHTESSHRFERGTDISIVPLALDRAAALIAELGGGRVLPGRLDALARPLVPRKVALRHQRLERLLGMKVDAREAKRILEALGFVLETAAGGEGTYAVPFARVDVEGEEDLVEEVARIRGYDAIPSMLPRGAVEIPPEPAAVHAERRAREALSGLGFDEAINYSFISPELQRWCAGGPLLPLGQDAPQIALKNPLSVEQSVLRRSLYPGLLQNVSRSLRHQAETLRLYELGRAYEPDPEGGRDGRPVARERSLLSGVLWGKRDGRSWSVPDLPMDFFDAKAGVEAVLEALAIEGARFESDERAPYHPRACARVVSGGGFLGTVGELHPRVAKALSLPSGLYLFELEADVLFGAAQKVRKYRGLDRFPAALRDLAVVVPIQMQSDQVRGVILEVGGALLEDARIFDVYSGKPIPEGKKNLAYALRYRARDRTLTDVEVNQAHERIVHEVNARLGGALRGTIS